MTAIDVLAHLFLLGCLIWCGRVLIPLAQDCHAHGRARVHAGRSGQCRCPDCRDGVACDVAHMPAQAGGDQ